MPQFGRGPVERPGLVRQIGPQIDDRDRVGYGRLASSQGNPSLVPEIVRYQSPVVHMGRTALSDAELNGKGSARATRARCGISRASGIPTASRTQTASSSTGRASTCRSGSAFNA